MNRIFVIISIAIIQNGVCALVDMQQLKEFIHSGVLDEFLTEQNVTQEQIDKAKDEIYQDLKEFIRLGDADDVLKKKGYKQEQIDKAKDDIDQENFENMIKESEEFEKAVQSSKLSVIGMDDFKNGLENAMPYQENPNRPLRIDEEGNKYYSYNVIGDGDCGLHCLNTTREKARKAVEQELEDEKYPLLINDFGEAFNLLKIPAEHLENRHIILIGLLQGVNVFIYNGAIPGVIDTISEDKEVRHRIPLLEDAPMLRIINESVDEDENPRIIESDRQGGHFRILANIDDVQMQAYAHVKEQLVPKQ